MKMYTSAIFAACCSLFSPLILAQTADGQTPAQESVCDGLPGAEKGLCNAYCEAMDCNLGADASAPPKACDKLRGNLQKITGNENASFPCDCPEVCVQAINAFVGSFPPPGPTDAQAGGNALCIYIVEDDSYRSRALNIGNSNFLYDQLTIGKDSLTGQLVCGAADAYQAVSPIVVSLTPGQVNICQAKMRQMVKVCNNVDPNPAP